MTKSWQATRTSIGESPSGDVAATSRPMIVPSSGVCCSVRTVASRSVLIAMSIVAPIACVVGPEVMSWAASMAAIHWVSTG